MMDELRFSEEVYADALGEAFEQIVGESWEEGKDDESGCYFSRGHWVSSKSIAEAMRAAFDAGVWKAEIDAV